MVEVMGCSRRGESGGKWMEKGLQEWRETLYSEREGDITLTLSLITSLDIQFNTPSPPSSLFGHPLTWNLLEAHGDLYLKWCWEVMVEVMGCSRRGESGGKWMEKDLQEWRVTLYSEREGEDPKEEPTKEEPLGEPKENGIRGNAYPYDVDFEIREDPEEEPIKEEPLGEPKEKG
nr:hypothetical protein [Tanacetum cinerariifolium]